MDFNCEKIVENYLLNKNPLYTFRFPISILVAIVFFGLSKAYNWSDNSYINQILIPVLTFFLTMVLLDFISRMMISKNEKDKLVKVCKLWMHDPSVKNHPILSKMVDMDAVSQYKPKIESFTNIKKVENFTINDNIYNFDLKMDNNESIREEIKNKVLEERKNISVENVENPISEIPNISPSPLEFKKENSLCIEPSGPYNLCSGSNSNPYNLVAPIPGPQWLPQSAETVQNLLKNNDYSKSA
jgi:hypothetical protein